jgi:hypothetical protein
MKFRTKIWMLPIGAAAVFVVGVAISFFVGNRTSGILKHLREIDSPHMSHVQVIDQSTEQLRLTLQTAAAEGDAEKLKEAEALVAKARLAVTAMGKLPEKAAISQELSAALEAYQSASIGATRALLTSQPPGDLVSKMQSSQGTLQKLMELHKKTAYEAITDAQHAASDGTSTAIWVSVVTGAIVLGVLGLASAAIVSSVWKDLGDEPSALRDLVARIADGDPSEIASGNQDLSQRTENTASNLQQTASLDGAVDQHREPERRCGPSGQPDGRSGAATAAERGGTWSRRWWPRWRRSTTPAARSPTSSA